MKLLWHELSRHKTIIFIALLLATTSQVFSLLEPQIFRLIIDNYATKASELSMRDFVTGVGILLLGSVSIAFISRTAKAFQTYYVNVITQRSGTNLYANSISHAFSLPYAVFEDQRSGELLGKMQKARNDSQKLIENVVSILFISLVSVVFVLIYSYTVNWMIGLAFTISLPLLGSAIFFLSRKIKEAQQLIVKETNALSGATTETLRNVELVKSLGLEEQEVARLNDVNDKILALELKKVRMVRKLDFIQGTLMNAMNSSILLLVLWLIFIESITLGQFFSLWFYSFWIFQPLYMIGALATSFQEAKASLEQLEEVLKLQPAPTPSDKQVLEKINKIEYKNISLKYESSSSTALSDINVTINPGETVAFVGPSGSGKSSMVKLLAGLYTPTEGQMLFNNLDVKVLDIDHIRRKIGLVAQETQLFAGSVRENLLFVRPDASDAEMIEAIEQAQAKSIMEKDQNSKGLETRIGEGGLKLSGGEKQRLAIARALLRKPDLLVFDEATSSLDSITEKAITETIQNINSKNKDAIKVIVAHRLSTISHADKIYVFEKGRIIESGTHESLIAEKGLYAALWREQVAD